ncbi:MULTISPECIES: nuclear transport factor 2 family protein [Thalassotalea]|uniref:Nuclear transport factor 2 family protein n=1 Tax=Thalassotalea castellviae TaxID=3075612 RepID=A0ABU3A209_9GAMM|nr:nuclear transport factor 2 family protein [Thalassotalea sp. W431]MDT0603918.1 nuclear transport factor 2 family protein [Thalassotalea sp. W431]
MKTINLALISLCLFLSFSSIAQTQYTGDKAQAAAVEKAVNYYLEGSLLGDPNVVAKAFHPDARVQGIRNGKHAVYDMKTFLGFFSTEKPGTHTTHIISVDIEENAASVRAEWDMGTWKYVDYLSLLKNNGEWKIVNKIYTVVKKAAKP